MIKKIPDQFGSYSTATTQRNIEYLSDMATPRGDNGAVQFNDDGRLNGGNLIFDKSINRITLSDTGKNISILLNRTDGAIGFWNVQATTSSTGTTNSFPFRLMTNNVVRVTINTDNSLTLANGASLTAGGVWTNASSAELKTGIEEIPLADCLQVLSSLRPVYFQYKDENGEPSGESHAGFIAEELDDRVASPGKTGVSAVDLIAIIVPVLKYILNKVEVANG